MIRTEWPLGRYKTRLFPPLPFLLFVKPPLPSNPNPNSDLRASRLHFIISYEAPIKAHIEIHTPHRSDWSCPWRFLYHGRYTGNRDWNLLHGYYTLSDRTQQRRRRRSTFSRHRPVYSCCVHSRELKPRAFDVKTFCRLPSARVREAFAVKKIRVNSFSSGLERRLEGDRGSNSLTWRIHP